MDSPASPTRPETVARALLETTVDGIIAIDGRGTITLFNPAAERIFGYAAGEVIGQNIAMLMPEPYREEHDGYLEAYHRTGRRRIIGIGREVTGRRKDGATFPMDLAVSEVEVDGHVVFAGIVRDISQRRRLEREVLRVADAERRRIGQDLHDGLGQQLTGIGLIARGLARTLDADGSPRAEDAAEIAQLVQDADLFARGLARGLVPVELEAGGLSTALERLGTMAERVFGVACTVSVPPAERFAPAATLDEPAHLFRIAQEAVSNAVRHGQAARIGITLSVSPERLRLRVEDDGVGFDEALIKPLARGEADVARGMGIRIMQYRARIVGGTLDIRDGAAGGAVVTCTVPLYGHRSAPGAPA